MKITKLLVKKVAAYTAMATLGVGLFNFPTNAAGVTTNVYSGYNHSIVVREAGSYNELGIMQLHTYSNRVENTYSATKKNAKTSTVYVSATNSSFKSKTVSGVYIGTDLTVSKAVNNPSTTYGYCNINY